MSQPSSPGWRALTRLARWAALAMVPLALLVHMAAPDRHLLLFGVSALGIIPLAGAMGHATDAYPRPSRPSCSSPTASPWCSRSRPTSISTSRRRSPRGPRPPRRGLGGAAGALLVSAALIAVLSEYLVASAEHAATALRLSDVFIGVMVIAVIGNAAEHSTAVLVARKDKMNLAITIAVESSRQIALFVAPVLVLLGLLFRQPMTLEFSLLEVGAVSVAVLIVNSIAQDGESNWLEGAMLLAMYLILGITFYILH